MRRGALLLAAALALSGCAPAKPKPVDFSEATKNYLPQDYEGVRRGWTRHAAIVRDVGTVLEVWATFKSWEYRQAYLELYDSIYDVPDTQMSAMRDQQKAAAREGYEFHVDAQSTNWKWVDFEKQESPWRLTLVDGTGAELAPLEIKVVKLPEMYSDQFFPTRTDFSKTYVIKFPNATEAEGGKVFRGVASGRIVLRAQGPLGRIDLVWATE